MLCNVFPAPVPLLVSCLMTFVDRPIHLCHRNVTSSCAHGTRPTPCKAAVKTTHAAAYLLPLSRSSPTDQQGRAMRYLSTVGLEACALVLRFVGSRGGAVTTDAADYCTPFCTRATVVGCKWRPACRLVVTACTLQAGIH